MTVDAKPLRFFRLYPDLETLESHDAKKSGLHALAHDDNIYLKTHYRKMPVMNWTRCLLSAFTLHNDTTNIWTHLLPGLLFLYWAFSSNVDMLQWNATFDDRLYYSFFCMCCATTMLVSAVYHIYRPHSENVYHFCLMCDLRGIILLICGSNTMVVAQSLKSFPALRSMMQMINFISFTSLTLWIPRCVQLRLTKQRTLYFALYAMVSALSWFIRHFMLVYDSNTTTKLVEHSWNHFGGLVVAYLIIGTGLVIFAMKIPERFFPKTFDLFGASHQLFHVFVVLGSYHALTCMLDLHRDGAFPSV